MTCDNADRQANGDAFGIDINDGDVGRGGTRDIDVTADVRQCRVEGRPR